MEGQFETVTYLSSNCVITCNTFGFEMREHFFPGGQITVEAQKKSDCIHKYGMEGQKILSNFAIEFV